MQSPFLEIDIAEIVIPKADEPDARLDFLDANGLIGQPEGEIDFLAVEAEPSAVGCVVSGATIALSSTVEEIHQNFGKL